MPGVVDAGGTELCGPEGDADRDHDEDDRSGDRQHAGRDAAEDVGGGTGLARSAIRRVGL
jgi:hypothetical protein